MLKVEKDREIFLNKGVFKTEPAPCKKPPQGGLTQGKKKEREKEKRNKNNHNKKDSTNKNCFSYGQIEHFCQQCPAKQRQQALQISPRLGEKRSEKETWQKILTPDVPVPMGVASPLPEDIVRLVLGCSALSLKIINKNCGGVWCSRL